MQTVKSLVIAAQCDELKALRRNLDDYIDWRVSFPRYVKTTKEISDIFEKIIVKIEISHTM